MKFKIFKNSTKNDAQMLRSFGVTLKQFYVLIARLKPLWEESERKRKDREGRKREIGGGRSYKLESLEEMILMVLFYYKRYPAQYCLGEMVGVDQATVSRLIRRLTPLIEKAADPELASRLEKAKSDLANGAKRIKSMEQFIKEYPDFRDVATDAFEQPIYRPQDYETQKEYYSGKTKQHAVKNQISVSVDTGIILDVSKDYPGKMHDKKIIDQEETVSKFPTQPTLRFDSGYQGLVKKYPQHTIVAHHKKPRNQELSPLAKELNQINSRRRIVVEHEIGKIKRYKICSDRYRGKLEDRNVIVRNVAALENLRLTVT